ncbi:MAG: hypothetical protein ABI759_22480 [Candidatus Solibacter sp.]
MLLLAAWLAFAQEPATSPNLSDLLSRLAEEAEILQQNAPKSLTQETLEQRALMPATRFRPRIGRKATEAPPPPPRLVVREIVSEYSVGALQGASEPTLTELRQVVSVDGRKVQSPERARHSLSLGVTSPDDRIRKRMLEDFARHGLVDIATDYGILLLAFSRRGLDNMQIKLAGEAQVGADAAWVLAFEQNTPDAGMLQFVGNEAARRALQGRILMRKADSLPLRIEVWTMPLAANINQLFKQWSGKAPAAITTGDEATIDYVRNPHGFLTPVSVHHRHLVDGKLITENLYRYEPFKRFSADADIKFTELPDTPKPDGKK